MSNGIPDPYRFLVALKAVQKGVRTALPAGQTQIVAGGRVSTLDEVDAELEGYIEVFQTAEDAEAAAEVALRARNEIAKTARARYQVLRAAVKVALGRHSPNLPKAGIDPDKERGPMTLETKIDAAAKRTATRKARHTMGPKQKAAVTGETPEAPETEDGTAPMPSKAKSGA